MKNFVAVAALIGSAALSAPAFAQDAGGIEAYAGVLAGYDHVVVKVPGDSGSKDGFIYGGVIGAQSTIGTSQLIGIEGEITGATTKETETDVFTAGDRAELKAGRDFFIGARFGFRANPNVLIYAKGGYTNARVKLKYTDVTGTVEEGDNLDGYRIGAGVEFGASQLRFRGEYRFSDYGDYKVNGVNTGISAQRHQVLVGAIYAF